MSTLPHCWTHSRTRSFQFLKVRHFSSNSKRWNSNPIPDLNITHPTLLHIESCNSMFQAKQIQAQMTRTGLIFHTFPVSRLLSFMALDVKGDIFYADKLFSQILQPNAYIWNTIIRGCVKNRFFDMGFRYFSRMCREGWEMDKRSYVFGLKACEGLRDFRIGECLHCAIRKVGYTGDAIVRNGLIHFYCEKGKLGCSSRVFHESDVKDVVSWTTLIDGYVHNGMADDALRVFDEMCETTTEPNEVTMVAVFSAIAKKRDLRAGERMTEFVVAKGFGFSLNMTNAMLDMYVKCEAMDKVVEIFNKMAIKDVFSWTCMINGHARDGATELARKFFNEMPYRNTVSWSAMIAGYSQNNMPQEALALFHDMEKQGLDVIESTLVSVVSACAQSGHMDIGHRIHDNYLNEKRISLTVTLGNAFIDMYAKCGNIVAAREIFDKMTKKDLVSYNSMVTAYASHGEAEKALDLLECMMSSSERLKPDDITLVGILSACAHGGLVEKGWEYFRGMGLLFGLTPVMEHYACMTDLLGRAGLLREAYELIKSMSMEPDKAIWGALLNGCRMYGNVELGKFAAEKLVDLDPEDSGIYVLLAGLCAKDKKWGDVRMARSVMREKGVKKNPGSSAIEVDGRYHEFLVSDESHPESEAIYKVLKEVLFLSKEEECSSLSYEVLDALC